ncbi:MAG: hypothetical protein ACRYFS_24515 [Janthinobacterium lividum]
MIAEKNRGAAEAAEAEEAQREAEERARRETLPPLRFLPENAGADALERYGEGVAERAPEDHVNYHWLENTLSSLPLPVPAEVQPRALSPVRRHARLTARITKLRQMAEWLREDIREMGYWGNRDVRSEATALEQSITDHTAALLIALERESWRDGACLLAAETDAIALLYRAANDKTVLGPESFPRK